MRRFRLGPLLPFALPLLLSCGGSGPTDTTGECVGLFCEQPETPVATTITLSPSGVTFNALGATEQLNATVLDQNGATMAGAAVNWTSSSSAVASVAGGLVTAVGNGTATIEATSGAATAQSSVTVQQSTDVVVVTPDTLRIVVGESQTLTAAALDPGGTEIAGANPSWSSDNPTVATVSPAGSVTGVSVGQAVATAMSQSIQGRAIVIVSPRLSVTTNALPNGVVGVAYSASLEAAGAGGSATWSITSGSLPAGLSLDGSTGAITGTPAAAGTASFTVQVTSGGQSATRALSITVDAGLAVTTASLANGVVGVAYSATLAAAGGDGTYSWALSAGSLPTGLGLNTSTGEISGTPTTVGSSVFTIEVTSAGNTATRQLTIAIAAPLAVTTTTLSGGVVGVDYGSQSLSATGGDGSYAWSLAAGSGPLPPGLSLSSSGVLTGTPVTAGTLRG